MDLVTSGISEPIFIPTQLSKAASSLHFLVRLVALIYSKFSPFLTITANLHRDKQKTHPRTWFTFPAPMLGAAHCVQLFFLSLHIGTHIIVFACTAPNTSTNFHEIICIQTKYLSIDVRARQIRHENFRTHRQDKTDTHFYIDINCTERYVDRRL